MNPSPVSFRIYLREHLEQEELEQDKQFGIFVHNTQDIAVPEEIKPY